MQDETIKTTEEVPETPAPASVDVSPEEASRIERLIQIGDESDVLPGGMTVGEYRRMVKKSQSGPGAAQEEAASISRQAAPAATTVRVNFTEQGVVTQPLVDEAKPEKIAGTVETIKVEPGQGTQIPGTETSKLLPIKTQMSATNRARDKSSESVVDVDSAGDDGTISK